MCDKIVCCACNEIIGYYDRSTYKHYNADKQLDENLAYEILPAENFQFIKPEKEIVKYLCNSCYELMASASKIKVSHNGKMEEIGYFDPRNNIIFVVEYYRNNETIDQDLIDQIKTAIINDNSDSDIIELKAINKLLAYYSYGEETKAKINKALNHLMKDKRYILINLQDSCGYLSSNKWFLIKVKEEV